MKKFLKLFILVLIAIFSLTLVACEMGGNKDEDGTEVSVDLNAVTNDEKTTVTYTEKSDNSLDSALNTVEEVDPALFGNEEAEKTANKADIKESIKEYLQYAKLSEAQIEQVCTLIVNNKALIQSIYDMGSVENPTLTVDVLKSVIKFYNDLIAITGDEFLGKLYYNAYTAEIGDTNPNYANSYSLLMSLLIGSFEYVDMAKYGKLIISTVSNAVNCLTDADLNVIVEVVNSTDFMDEKPTNAQLEGLFDILAKVIESSKFTNGTYTAIAELVNKNIGVLVDNVSAEYLQELILRQPTLSTLLTTENIATLKTSLQALITTMIQFADEDTTMLANFVNSLNANECAVIFAECDFNYDYNSETQRFDYIYTIDGVTVTEEEYDLHETKVNLLVGKLLLNAYNGIPENDRATMVTALENFVKIIDNMLKTYIESNAEMKEAMDNMTPPTTESKSFNDLMDALQTLVNVDMDATDSSTKLDEATDALETVAVSYLYTLAPHLSLIFLGTNK